MSRWDADWFKRLNKIVVELADRPLEEQSEIRRSITSQDPVAFAYIYLSKHLKGKETGNKVTFSEVHFQWAEMARGWMTPPITPMADRKAVIAPRSTGKSTWWFLINPLWAAAHGYIKFAAAFAHSTGQSEAHLQTMKHELDTNALLMLDFPLLCQPAKRPRGTTVADRQSMLHMKSGFTFCAKGIDSSSLGLKVGELRPDLLILDDVEPDESSYSAYLAEKRLSTVTDAIFPLNIYARVIMVGTVTMPGSIMHQMVKVAHGSDAEAERWIREEHIQPHHHRAIAVNDDGTERSIWPQKWPLDWLQSRRHTREYAKNYDNDPMAREGVYWLREDFHYDKVQGCTRTLLAIDPAVTAKKTSDFTGLAIVSYSPMEQKCVIKYAAQVRLTGRPLRDHVVDLLGKFPEIKLILVETIQGGDLWKEVFEYLPNVRVKTLPSQAGSKEVRFAEALDHWQQRKVMHATRLPVLEEQAVAFPRAPYDDVIDAAVSGVQYFLAPQRKVKATVAVSNYM